MNDKLKDFAKSELISGLKQCTEKQVLLFKRMYCHDNLGATIEEAVDNVPDEKIDWAMQQVNKTLENNLKKARQN